MFAGPGGVAGLPAGHAVGRGERLAREVHARDRSDGGEVMLRGVEIGAVALQPRALARGLGDDERDRDALDLLAAALEEDAAGLAEARGGARRAIG